MKTRTDEEKQLNTELNETIRQFEATIRQMLPEQRAYYTIRQFLRTENPADELREQFHRWLISPENAEAKERALERCFEELMVESEHPMFSDETRVAVC